VDLPLPGYYQHGQVIDVLLSVRRDLAAARRFFTRALRAGTVPAEVTTDRGSGVALGRLARQSALMEMIG
jgi:transposase-like protein